MDRRTLFTQVGLTAFYFAAVFCILFFYTQGSIFCRGVNGHLISTTRLAIACTGWNLIASLCGAIAFHGLRFARLSSVFVSVAVAFAGFASVPFWIFKGYGHFYFENTSADVSCFFYEGYAMAFPYVVAPLLAVATLLCEYLAYRTTKKDTGKTS
jgi:hypothetical protein